MDGGRLGRGPTTIRVAGICSSDVSGLLRPQIRSEHLIRTQQTTKPLSECDGLTRMVILPCRNGVSSTGSLCVSWQPKLAGHPRS